jgi:hypothetical protein
MRRPSFLLLLTAALPAGGMAWVASREEFLGASLSLVIAPTTTTAPPTAATAIVTPPRTVDVGGGVDLLTPLKLESADALFPPSMKGVWICQRTVLSVDGDSYQADQAWRALGGSKKPEASLQETFSTRFLPVNDYTVMDRGFELSFRKPGAEILQWNADQPNRLVYSLNNKSPVELQVIKRTVEPPSDVGFGYQELVRIHDNSPNLRAALVKRRYRRSFDDNQNRVVEGIELVKTFRVLDGIAGTEFPTSTIKSKIYMERP